MQAANVGFSRVLSLVNGKFLMGSDNVVVMLKYV
jgi:hypothetical protein